MSHFLPGWQKTVYTFWSICVCHQMKKTKSLHKEEAPPGLWVTAERGGGWPLCRKSPGSPPPPATGRSLLSCAVSHPGRHTTARTRPPLHCSVFKRTSPPSEPSSDTALTGAPRCFTFQASLFQAHGKLRGNCGYNWGLGSYGLCIQHETTG